MKYFSEYLKTFHNLRAEKEKAVWSYDYKYEMIYDS